MDLLSTRLAQGGTAELVDTDHGVVIGLHDGVVDCVTYPNRFHDDIAVRALCGVPLMGRRGNGHGAFHDASPLTDYPGAQWLLDPSPLTLAREILMRNGRALGHADMALTCDDVLVQMDRASSTEMHDGVLLGVTVWSYDQFGRSVAVLDGTCPDNGISREALSDHLAQSLGIDVEQVSCELRLGGIHIGDDDLGEASLPVGPVDGLTGGLRDWLDECLVGDGTLSDGELSVGRSFLDGFEAAMGRLTGAVPAQGHEDKRLFCELVSAALVACGDGRYDDLTREGPHYDDKAISYLASRDGTAEFVLSGPWAMDVTGDSLTALGRDVLELASGSSDRVMSADVIRDWVDKLDAGTLSQDEGGHHR